MPTFKNEIAPDFSQPPDQQQPKLELDRESLEEKITKFEERIESLGKMLIRSHESKLHNKVNEIQEELCQRKFDLYVAQIHLSAVRSQLQLFEYNFRPLSSIVGHDGALADFQAEAAANLAQSSANVQTGSIGSAGPIGAQTRRSPQSSSGGSGGANQQAAANQGAMGGGSGGGGGSGASSSNSGVVSTPLGYRSKWIKAFKSLKETPSSQQQAQK